jgi:hypothetical protein
MPTATKEKVSHGKGGSTAVIVGLSMLQLRAQCVNGPTTINIELRHCSASYSCYATACFNPASQKDSKIRNQQGNVRSWRSGMLKDEERSAREEEKLQAMERCYASLCTYARCRRIDAATGACVGAAYFYQ